MQPDNAGAISSSGYVATRGPTRSMAVSKYFTMLVSEAEFQEPEAKIEHCDCGLKFHITLDDQGGRDEQNRAKGWDIVKDILIEHGVSTFKVVNADKTLSNISAEKGKDTAIYTKYNPNLSPADWENILKKIILNLIAQDVRPGLLPSTGFWLDNFAVYASLPSLPTVTHDSLCSEIGSLLPQDFHLLD